MAWSDTADQLAPPIIVAQAELAVPSAISTPLAHAANNDEAGPARHALILVRLHSRPLGTILVETADGQISPERCQQQAWEQLGPAIADHLRHDGLPAILPVPASADAPPRCQPAPRDTPAEPATVVVATRDRPWLLKDCLDALARLDYPDYEVVVVDNDPETDGTAELLRTRPGRFRYVTERRRGLAAAHNRGLEVAAGSIVAFTDDDVIVDRHWLANVQRAMRSKPGVACVTGLIMPAELATRAQLMMELHGNFAKGFAPRVVNTTDLRPPDPLFPFTVGKLGSGANMSYDRDTLRELGGFDPALGTGTFARGGDDLATLFDVLAAGHSIAYEPEALVWHRHRRDAESLTGQAYGYGVGLGAYLTGALMKHPGMIGPALRRAPGGLRHALTAASPQREQLASAWPRKLVWLERRGLAFGLPAYAVSARRARRAQRAAHGAQRLTSTSTP